MSAHVLLNLLYIFVKTDRMRGLLSILKIFAISLIFKSTNFRYYLSYIEITLKSQFRREFFYQKTLRLLWCDGRNKYVNRY